MSARWNVDMLSPGKAPMRSEFHRIRPAPSVTALGTTTRIALPLILPCRRHSRETNRISLDVHAKPAAKTNLEELKRRIVVHAKPQRDAPKGGSSKAWPIFPRSRFARTAQTDNDGNRQQKKQRENERNRALRGGTFSALSRVRVCFLFFSSSTDRSDGSRRCVADPIPPDPVLSPFLMAPVPQKLTRRKSPRKKEFSPSVKRGEIERDRKEKEVEASSNAYPWCNDRKGSPHPKEHDSYEDLFFVFFAFVPPLLKNRHSKR